MGFWNHLKNNIKKYLFFGIATFVPAYITILLISKIIGFFDDIIIRIVTMFALPPFMRFLTYPAVGAFLCFIFLIILGFVSRQYLGKKVMYFVEKTFAFVPVSRQIYAAIKKMTDSLINKDQTKFKRVVFVPFPHRDVYAIAFLTGENPNLIEGQKFYYVYVPTAINPTSGFLISVKEELIIHSDMKVDEAFSLILSGGLVSPKP